MGNRSKNLKQPQGFTLIETLVAIAILSVVVMAPLSIASSGLSAATISKDRLLAIALAREAVEYIRNQRDNNRIYNFENPSLTPRDWLYGASGFDNCKVNNLTETGCSVSVYPTGLAFKRINTSNGNSNDDGVLMYNAVTFVYTDDNSNGWVQSQFTRHAKVWETFNDREALISVTVSWPTLYSSAKSITLIETITNW